jgi:hypothetical protein
MENYRLIPMTDQELVYLPVLLKPTSGGKRHPDLLTYIPTLPTWLISLQWSVRKSPPRMMRHTMRLIAIFALAILAAPLASDVKPATPVDRIGRLSSGTPPAGPDPS